MPAKWRNPMFTVCEIQALQLSWNIDDGWRCSGFWTDSLPRRLLISWVWMSAACDVGCASFVATDGQGSSQKRRVVVQANSPGHKRKLCCVGCRIQRPSSGSPQNFGAQHGSRNSFGRNGGLPSTRDTCHAGSRFAAFLAKSQNGCRVNGTMKRLTRGSKRTGNELKKSARGTCARDFYR